MNINEIITEYRQLSQRGGFSPTATHRQAAHDFIVSQVKNIDFIFDDVCQIFRLIDLLVGFDDVASFKVLLANGFDINTMNHEFKTVFTSNGFVKNLDFVMTAYETHAKFAKTDKHDKNFFRYALEAGVKEDVIDYIFSLPLFAGSPADNEMTIRVMAGGETLFHTAVRTVKEKSMWGGGQKQFDTYALEQFLQAGVNVDLPYTYQELRGKSVTSRAIHMAVEKLNLPVVQLLIAHGADTAWENSAGKTPVDIVLDDSRIQDRERTEELRKNLLLLLVNSIKDGSKKEQVITKALFKMAYESAHAPNGSRFADRMSMLCLELGANINYTYDDGTTLLHLTALSGNFDLFKHCVKSGMDINAKNNAGDTPLILACRNSWGRASLDKIAMALIRAGVNTTITNIKGENVVDILSKKGNMPMLELVLQQQ